ncbi:hypothetical protein AAFF_G00364230 [Aldrovandia affinis]|uniref:Cilia- and flagella-associated protein 43 n=1 Tax=Aldrovandia affinis TaxID=143900 RepID=A0AAD7SHN2_9TELE|nr:hypothetical protein AAFF_G00364230 [Aldrovandia affinis]
MQGAIVRVCVVVAAAILNHPLLFTKENTTIPESDDELMARMREHEERLEAEQARLEDELSWKEQEAMGGDGDPETGYGWYFWSALSLIIFLTIEVYRQDFIGSSTSNPTQEEEEEVFTEGTARTKALFPDKGVLSSFYERCIRVSAHEACRTCEFVEGFADDLLEALRSVSDREADMEVEDCLGVGSMFESWRVSKPLTCDLIVPFAPPEPYGFKFQLWCSPSGDIPPDMQGCGRIKVAKVSESGAGCLCGTTDLGEDMLCLLHGKNEKPRASDGLDDLLCSKNTPYLAKDQVMKWFQISVTKAWGRISHKYEFELTFRNLDAPGALKVRFRSGRVIVLNITPVVQFEDSDAYFVSHFPSENGSHSDTYWSLSFAVYEKNLLKYLAKSLPENPCHIRCLQIVSFLHKKQTGLTGRSALSNYHLKTALLHLLLVTEPSVWGFENLELRLHDVMSFLEKSLQEKRLYEDYAPSMVTDRANPEEPSNSADVPSQSLSSVLLLLDLSAAFDTVDHRILLSSLVKMGISGSALTWLESYLADRSYQVAWRGSLSSPHTLSTGVPQWARHSKKSARSLGVTLDNQLPLRSASSGKLTVPSLRAPGSRSSRSRLFSVLIPHWWNDLPQSTKKRSVLLSPGRGIGAFAANGLSKTLAFSEQKPNPSIFVYSYPELVQKSELKDYTLTICVINLPAADGSVPEAEARLCHNHNENPNYYGPQMPIAAIAGIKGDEAEGFVPKAKMKVKLYPSSLCWTASSDLYVGCRQGHLLQVNPDSQSILVLVNPLPDPDLSAPDRVTQLQEGSLQTIALHKDGLFAVTSLACCPAAQFVAVGTDTGHVLFIDLTTEEWLQTAGAIVGLSTQYNRENKQVKVLALCTGLEDGEMEEGSRLVTLSLPVQQLTGAVSCSDIHGYLSGDLLQKYQYEVPKPLSSAVLGPNNKIFGYCHKSKTLQQFHIPEGTCSSNTDVVQLTLEKEVEGHPLGPASLLLSPHQLWLASVGKDGLLRIRETCCIEKYLETQCHRCWLGGVRTVSFCTDSQTIITTGINDGSMVCTQLRLGTDGSSKASEAAQHGRFLLAEQENSRSLENPILSRMPEWNPDAPSRSGSSLQCTEEKRTIDVTEQDESYTSASSAMLPDPTWLDNKREEAFRKESQQYAGVKKSLRRDIRQLRETIQAMMRENQTLSEMESLEPQEFNLDMEAKKRLLEEGEVEVAKVRSEIELENLAKAYLGEVIKKECWDSMQVKGKAVKAFHSEHEVKNYPMKARLQKEQEEMERVHTMRKIEHEDRMLQHEIVERKIISPNSEDQDESKNENGSDQEMEKEKEGKEKETEEKEKEKEEEEEEEVDKESPALTGSLSAQHGGANSYLHSQFDLHVREEKINQIILLQDVISKVKTTFNKEFEATYKQKEQEINRVKERNKRIREIMLELEVEEELWEPAMSDSEKPEKALTVDESEIKVEKYLSLEQRQNEEESKKAEEQRQRDSKSDNVRERALDDMMHGVLEMKEEGILKTEISQPEFMSRPEEVWSDEEKKSFKEYDKKVKELIEEQEKHRKTLETEMKKLQTAIKEGTHGFDEILTKLFERKVSCEMVICQEELKIANLAQSLLMEEEIHNSEEEFGHKLEKAMALKSETGEQLQNYKKIVDDFRETYDNTVAEDKLLDRGFKKEFTDIPSNMVDQLYKLYKRRPRVQRIRAQTDDASEGASQMIKAMEDLDRPENMPEDLDASVWQRFCQARRAKVESEQRVKRKALALADMQAFLQRRLSEEENVKAKITNIMADLNSLREEKMVFQLDLMVQILLKQGQVEVETGRFVPDFSDSELTDRNVVEDLNGTIRTLGEQKIASMVESKDFRKGIIQQEWEHKRMRMKIEDLTNKARDIQMLRVTLELQETHNKDVKTIKKMIEDLERQVAHKVEQKALLEKQLAGLKVAVAERTLICDAIAMEQAQHGSSDDRFREIVDRKKLVDLAKDQAEELILLRADLEKMRRRTFPDLTNLN